MENIIIGLEVKSGAALAQIDRAAEGLRAVDKAERDIAKDSKAAAQGQSALNAQFAQTAKDANKATGALSALRARFADVATIAATVGIGAGISGLVNEIIRGTAQFEKFQAVLANTLGDQTEADLVFGQLQQFAATTNFSLEELTDGFIKLTNQGFQPTQAELTKLADIANSTGKSFDQLVEATLDATRGENERLKEFGITAKTNADTVEFSFKGVTTVVQRNSQAIREYILSLGDLQGVQGSTAAISKTLGGQLSNLGDQFTATAVEIGNNLKPAITLLIQGVSLLLQGLGTLVGFVAKNITGFTLLAAAILSVKYQSVIASVFSLARAKELLALGVGKVTTAFKALRAAFIANPIGAVLATVTALAGAVLILSNRLSKAEEQQKAFGQSIDDVNANVQAEKAGLNALFDQLKKTGEGTDERRKIIQQVNQQYGQYLPNLLAENASLEDIAKAQAEANKQLEASIKLRAFEELLIETTKAQTKAQLELNKAVAANNLVLNALPTAVKNFVAGSETIGSLINFGTGVSENTDLVAEYQKEINFLTKSLADLREGTVPTTDATKTDEKAVKAAQKAYDDLTKAVEKYRMEQAKALAGAELAAIENPFQKALAESFGNLDEVMAEGIELTKQAVAQNRPELVATINAGIQDGLASLVTDARTFLKDQIPNLSPAVIAGFDQLLADVAKGADADAVKVGVSDLFAQAAIDGLSEVFGIAFLPAFGPLFFRAGQTAGEEFADGLQRRLERTMRMMQVPTPGQGRADADREAEEWGRRQADAASNSWRKQWEELSKSERIDLLTSPLDDAMKLAQELNQIEVDRTDRFIAEQEKRVAAAEEAAATLGISQLAEERKRLDALNKERERFVRRQQQLAVIELVANSAVAIARAAAEGGIAAPFTIAATLLALVAGIAQARAAAQSALPQFEQGGYVQGPRHAQGGKVIEVEGGEYVFNRRATAIFGKDFLDRMNAGIIPNVVVQGNGTSPVVNMRLETLERGLARVESAVRAIPTAQINITERGIHAASVRGSKANTVSRQSVGL